MNTELCQAEEECFLRNGHFRKRKIRMVVSFCCMSHVRCGVNLKLLSVHPGSGYSHHVTYFERRQMTILLYWTVSAYLSCKMPFLSLHDSYHSHWFDKRNVLQNLSMAVSVALSKRESVASVLPNSTGGGIDCLFIVYIMMLWIADMVWCWMYGWLMNNELERVWMEVWHNHVYC